MADLAAQGERRHGGPAAIGRLSDEQVVEQLTQVKGIGRWTAQMFLIFSLGRPDVFPHDDLGVRTAIRDRYGLAELPDKATSHAIAAPWRAVCLGGKLVLLAVAGPGPEHEDRGEGVSDRSLRIKGQTGTT